MTINICLVVRGTDVSKFAGKAGLFIRNLPLVRSLPGLQVGLWRVDLIKREINVPCAMERYINITEKLIGSCLL